VSKGVGVWKVNQLIGQICCHSRPFCVADWAARRVDKPATGALVLYRRACQLEWLPTGYHGHVAAVANVAIFFSHMI
jgi:hypothetical protein